MPRGHARTNSLSLHGFSREYLTEEQNELVNELLHELESRGVDGHGAQPLTDEDRVLLGDDRTLVRYLVARDWNVGKAAKLLRSTMRWRHDFQPDTVTYLDVRAAAHAGKMFRLPTGNDRHNRPILVMRPRFENNAKDTAGNMRFLVYCLQDCVQHMTGDAVQMTLIIDLKGISRSSMPSVSAALETIKILGDHYPERLACALIVDAPFIFNMLWTAVKPIINSRTHSKIQFISSVSSTSGQEKMRSVIAPEVLPRCYGGTSEWEFDALEYFAETRSLLRDAGVDPDMPVENLHGSPRSKQKELERISAAANGRLSPAGQEVFADGDEPDLD